MEEGRSPCGTFDNPCFRLGRGCFSGELGVCARVMIDRRFDAEAIANALQASGKPHYVRTDLSIGPVGDIFHTAQCIVRD